MSNETTIIDHIRENLEIIHQKKPLILCLTNFVTVEFVANALLSIGAAPIMSNCEDEIEELMAIASALYINIGTLDRSFISLATKAAELAKKFKKPVILDPVGSGATALRTKCAADLLPFAQMVRGNSSEIISLAGAANATYGVEATHTTDEASPQAKALGEQYQTLVVVSGPVDFITNGEKVCKVPFGSPLMQQITGMGCSLTGIMAAFLATEQDDFSSAVKAAHFFALSGEVTSLKYPEPGSFKTAFLDQLHKPNFSLMRELYDQRR